MSHGPRNSRASAQIGSRPFWTSLSIIADSVAAPAPARAKSAVGLADSACGSQLVSAYSDDVTSLPSTRTQP